MTFDFVYQNDEFNNIINDTGSELKDAVFKSYDKLLCDSCMNGFVEYWNNDDVFFKVSEYANKNRRGLDALLLIGIGGSFLGTKSFIEALNYSGSIDESSPRIYYIGTNLSDSHINSVFESLENKSVHAIVISKSGATIEIDLAFRLTLDFMKQKYGVEYNNRLCFITSEGKGKLFNFAVNQNIKYFLIPNNIGGRYSIFTPVGLLPFAFCGINIFEILKAYKEFYEKFISDKTIKNSVIQYAAIRNFLYQNGYKIELLCSFLPELETLGKWWQQLFAESEGKEGRGIFPVPLSYTTDLHSVGQYVQEGGRIIFETFLEVQKYGEGVNIPNDLNGNPDYLSSKTFKQINDVAFNSTLKAHVDGGVPCIKLSFPKINEFYLTKVYCFFMFSCAISAYTLDVNPFNQEGVEKYKQNMLELLK